MLHKLKIFFCKFINHVFNIYNTSFKLITLHENKTKTNFTQITKRYMNKIAVQSIAEQFNIHHLHYAMKRVVKAMVKKVV